MERALRSFTKTPSSFSQPPPAHQPPLLPLPAQAHPFWPASRPAPRAKKPRCHAAPNPKMGPSAPITVAAPSKKRAAPAPAIGGDVEWTETDSLYSLSPPPSCVPMPTSLLATARKVPTACAVEVAGAGGTVDVGATDELRRLLRL